MKQLEKDLRKARDLIAAPDGFVKEEYQFCALAGGTCSYCTTGAVLVALVTKDMRGWWDVSQNRARRTRRDRAFAALTDALQTLRPAMYARLLREFRSEAGYGAHEEPPAGEMLIAFNDRKSTKQKDVVALYDEAIRAVSGG